MASQPSQTLSATVEFPDRLDRFLALAFPEVSRARFQRLIAEGHVSVEGVPATEIRHKLKAGQRVEAVIPPAVDPEPRAETIPLTVVYEDKDLIVIDKPAGLVVHPGAGNETGTLVNALIAHCGESLSGIGGIKRPGIVHRLDKDTSGLLVVAKTLEAQTDLVRQLQARTVKRQYLAFVAGVVFVQSTIDAPIGRHPAQRVKMAVVPETRGGKAAITHYRGLEQFDHCALIECTLETGRTHQIRVHMASVKHPLLGDKVYGRADPRLPAFPRQALHATRLALVHPLEQRLRQWEVPMPADMLELLETLRYG